MNFLKADTGGFDRLLASLGLILIALALVLPWAVARETGTLRIKESELSEYTETAQAVLRQRQRRIADVQSALPYAAGVLVAVGGVLLIIGARGMKTVQPWEKRELQARTQQAEASIRQQTEEEVAKKAREEAEDSIAASVSAGADLDADAAPRDSMGPASSAAQTEIDETVVDALSVEDAVLRRLEEVTPAGYTFAARVLVEPTQMQLDGLFSAADRYHPDIPVEIKAFRAWRGEKTVRRDIIHSVIANTVRYRDVTGRDAVTWLIVVVPDDVPSSELVELERHVRRGIGVHGTARVVRRNDVPALTVPSKL